jgi:hypothetical protein
VFGETVKTDTFVVSFESVVPTCGTCGIGFYYSLILLCRFPVYILLVVDLFQACIRCVCDVCVCVCIVIISDC